MNATLRDFPIETPEPLVSCANCPAVLRLERALEELRADFRREVGYWKSQHANAVTRIERLKEELDQSRGQVRVLQDKLFGRKSDIQQFLPWNLSSERRAALAEQATSPSTADTS